MKEKPRIQSNSGKLTGWLKSGASDQPLLIDGGKDERLILREEDEDEVINLDDIPAAEDDTTSNKRRRNSDSPEMVDSGSDTDDSVQCESRPAPKRTRRARMPIEEEDAANADEDKKKLGMKTYYDGFSIYGRILCLVVKRKGPRTSTGRAEGSASSQHMLENWVSTQAAAEQVGDDEDNG